MQVQVRSFPCTGDTALLVLKSLGEAAGVLAKGKTSIGKEVHFGGCGFQDNI